MAELKEKGYKGNNKNSLVWECKTNAKVLFLTFLKTLPSPLLTTVNKSDLKTICFKHF